MSASNKVYDATAAANLTGTPALSGKLGSDVVTLGGSPSATFPDKNVGSGRTVTVTGYTVSGADAGNYSFSQPTGLAADITVASLSVTGVTAQNKTYDRTTAATLAGSATLAGLISGDTVTLGGSASATFADSAAGTNKAVTVTGYTISGADAADYTLGQPTGLTADITKKGLTVTGVSAQNKTYDRTTSATLTGTPTLVGVIGPDAVALGGSATAAFADAGVGTAKAVTVSGYTISGADSINYTLTQPSLTSDITAKSLTVSGVTAQAKVYDGGTSATLGMGSASLVGVIGGDTVSLNTGAATGSFATKVVGVGKTVTVAGLTLSGADAGNYSVSQPTTTASITAKPLTVSNITAQNKTYDGGTTANLNVGTASLNGVVGGDTVLIDTSAAVGTFASKDAATGIAVSVSGITAAGTDAGNYTVTQPATSADITAKGLTISGAVGQNKTYDASTAAVVDFSGATLVGRVGADSVSIHSSSASADFDTKDVGTGKPITVSGVTLTGSRRSRLHRQPADRSHRRCDQGDADRRRRQRRRQDV